MLFDSGADFVVHRHHRVACQIWLGVIQRKRTFFASQMRRGQIRRARDCFQPFLRLPCGLVRAIAQAYHQKCIRQPGDTQPDPAFCHRFGLLFRQREAAGVDYVIHHPDGYSDQFTQRVSIKRGGFFKRVGHKPRQVDRA